MSSNSSSKFHNDRIERLMAERIVNWSDYSFSDDSTTLKCVGLFHSEFHNKEIGRPISEVHSCGISQQIRSTNFTQTRLANQFHGRF